MAAARKGSATSTRTSTRTTSRTTSRSSGRGGTARGRAAGAAGAGERGAERNRALQREADAKRARTAARKGAQKGAQKGATKGARKSATKGAARKAGARARGGGSAVQPEHTRYPENPLPAQHQAKPGSEAALTPRPRYEAPEYRGSGKLAGKVALITGGDSGIGRAVAVLYAREGADVAILYLSEHEDAEETARAVEDEGRRAILIPGDVTSSAFCREAVERTVRELGRLDVLVNNAAFQQHAERLEDISDEQWDRTFRTNIYGYFYMARAALEHLDDGGVILNTSSVTGLEGSKELLDYASTKGAINAFTQSLAQNLVERGIRVNAVAPGPVWTPLNPADRPADKVKDFGKHVPMQRPAQPEELAPAYVFLAAPVDSSYITGNILPVLGGKTVK